MRRIMMLSLAVAGTFMLASATVAQANWSEKSGGSDGTTSGMMSPPSGPGTEAPEVGTYEYQQALETGNLPPSDGSVSRAPSSSGGEENQVIEQGGVEFRGGIDGE